VVVLELVQLAHLMVEQVQQILATALVVKLVVQVS
jgi:hypothetical protein